MSIRLFIFRAWDVCPIHLLWVSSHVERFKAEMIPRYVHMWVGYRTRVEIKIAKWILHSNEPAHKIAQHVIYSQTHNEKKTANVFENVSKIYLKHPWEATDAPRSEEVEVSEHKKSGWCPCSRVSRFFWTIRRSRFAKRLWITWVYPSRDVWV